MIDRAFFERDPITCAQELIGCELVWNDCVGVIVETEAYAAVGDEACHTFARPSARAFVAEHAPGSAYVYLNYGMHWLFNVLVKGGTADGFVLIRALEPVRGLNSMKLRRTRGKSMEVPIRALCSGPGKLTIAMGINGRDHGRDLCEKPRFGFCRPKGATSAWICDRRIGISKAVEFPWRFLLRDSEFVSAKPTERTTPFGEKMPQRVVNK